MGYITAGIDECDLVRCLLSDIEPYLGYTCERIWGEYRTAGIDECDLVRCLLCDIEPYLGYTVREYGINIELQVLMSAPW